ncbi:MAG: site-2 protease family protein [Planctomycetota bacterium]|nr:site-2 protease family protein [Planctomycetota bacterium]
MKWSLNLGSVSGIRIYVHWTFMLLVGWILFVQLGAGRNPLEAARSVLFIIAIFGCITLHELGHALTAKRYGIRTRDITLLPIGGLARLERLPENPTHELWVALAGPAVNVAIAAGLYVMLRLAYGAALPEFAFDIAEGSFLTNLMYVNLGIVVFNLLPAFPMDGGGCCGPCWRTASMRCRRPASPRRWARRWRSSSDSPGCWAGTRSCSSSRSSFTSVRTRNSACTRCAARWPACA